MSAKGLGLEGFECRSLLKKTLKEIQRANNESTVPSLAEALLDYDISFPAFQDFREFT